ncbi:MAG: response regulator [Candidatus Firestonebacteria bacterium]
MKIPLKALIVEDVATDAALLLRNLEKDGFSVISRRVETELEMKAALSNEAWDIILSDCSLPAFSDQAALRLVKETKLDIPVIIISGTIGEEIAIELMRGGAADIVYKSKMLRLGQIIRRELDHSLTRREERKHFEELTISESKYKGLFEAANIGILMINAETGMIIDVNPYLIMTLGYTKKELIEKKIWEVRPLKDIIANKIYFEEWLKNKSISYNDLKLETKSGKPMEYDITRNVYAVGKQKILELTIKDNTERKSAERARLDLEEQQEEQLKIFNKQLNNIINAVGDPFFIKDANCVFVFVNDAFCDILGMDRSAILGKTLAETLPQEQMKHFLGVDKKVLESGYENVCEEQLTGKGGKLLEIVTRKTRYINEEGSKFVVGVIHDVTEQKNTEKQLLHSHKMESLGVLAGGIAHDFNNLLTVIRGNAYLAKNKGEGTIYNAEELEEIEKTAERAAELTKQMLLFSRQQPMNAVDLDLNEIVSDVMKMLKRIIGEDIKIEIDLQDGLWTIVSDKTRQEQIIMNIAINARDSMPGGGKILIKTENIILDNPGSFDNENSYCGKFVKITMQDNGIGISKSILENIFDPFFTTKGVGKGTGLGLSVVYGIVKQHKGWINVDSELGKGSIFSIYLPANIKVKPALIDKSIKIKNLKGQGERILIVEDEPGIRKLLQILLTGNGYRVFPAGSASEALEVFNREKHNFDIVISDIVLPDKNGIELVKDLLSVNPALKIVFSSGYMDEKVQSEIIQTSGHEFIQKPYDLNALLSVVKKALYQK